MKWTTRDGRQIEIRDMTDSHLFNTIAYLRRRHDQAVDAGYGMLGILNGEAARESVECELTAIEDHGPAMTSPAYNALLNEADRRKMKLPLYHGDPSDAVSDAEHASIMESITGSPGIDYAD